MHRKVILRIERYHKSSVEIIRDDKSRVYTPNLYRIHNLCKLYRLPVDRVAFAVVPNA